MGPPLAIPPSDTPPFIFAVGDPSLRFHRSRLRPPRSTALGKIPPGPVDPSALPVRRRRTRPGDVFRTRPGSRWAEERARAPRRNSPNPSPLSASSRRCPYTPPLRSHSPPAAFGTNRNTHGSAWQAAKSPPTLPPAVRTPKVRVPCRSPSAPWPFGRIALTRTSTRREGPGRSSCLGRSAKCSRQVQLLSRNARVSGS